MSSLFAYVKHDQHSLRCTQSLASVLNFALGIVILALLAALFAHRIDNPVGTCSNAYTVDDTLCATGNNCTVGLLDAEGVSCLTRTKPTTAGCGSPCYAADSTTTFCDANGTCVGDVADCLGSCTSTTCHIVTDNLNIDLIGSFDPLTFWTYEWLNPDGCYFGKCVGSVLDIFAGTTVDALFHNASQPYTLVPLGARNKCTDYLNKAFADQGCLRTARYLIDPNLTDYALFSDGDYGNQTFPFQLSVCLYSYVCSSVEASLVAPSSTTVTSNIQSAAEHGFMPLGTADEEFALLSSSAYHRHTFWSDLRNKTLTTLRRTPANVTRALIQRLLV